MTTLHRAVFIDRDGTLIKERGYITSIRQVRFFQGTASALNRLRKAGYKLVIVTNQAGIARGLLTEKILRRINNYILGKFRRQGVIFSRVYYCPHHPEGTIAKYRRHCRCRKPSPGMLLQARRDLHINLKQSFVIGDARRDLLCGKKVGAKSILVLTGQGRKTTPTLPARTAVRSGGRRGEKKLADFIAPNLNIASKWIINRNYLDV